ncbi:MAG: hypothetical protein KDA60_12255, partial [Planctomycetales bacterium]|nr:hypothetical protein [Planctomycetales bacterium]
INQSTTNPRFVALKPGDINYPPVTTTPTDRQFKRDITAPSLAWLGRGAYVDLGYLVAIDDANNYVFERAQPQTRASDQAASGDWYSPGLNRSLRISHFSGVPSFRDGGNAPGVYDPKSTAAEEYFWDAYGVPGNASTALYYRTLPTLRYDTWATYYERDGIDQDGDLGQLDTNNDGMVDNNDAYFIVGRNGIDEGTNGIDDNPIDFPGVDDISEREMAPPYDVPLRGIEVRIRKMHFETRQIRQVSVVGDFVPE